MNNMKGLYDISRQIAGSSFTRTVPVKSRDGMLLTNVDEQISRWREYFEEVLNLSRDGNEVVHDKNVFPDSSPVVFLEHQRKTGSSTGGSRRFLWKFRKFRLKEIKFRETLEEV